MIPLYEKIPMGKVILGDQPLPGCKEVLTMLASRKQQGKTIWKALGLPENDMRLGASSGWDV